MLKWPYIVTILGGILLFAGVFAILQLPEYNHSMVAKAEATQTTQKPANSTVCPKLLAEQVEEAEELPTINDMEYREREIKEREIMDQNGCEVRALDPATNKQLNRTVSNSGIVYVGEEYSGLHVTITVQD